MKNKLTDVNLVILGALAVIFAITVIAMQTETRGEGPHACGSGWYNVRIGSDGDADEPNRWVMVPEAQLFSGKGGLHWFSPEGRRAVKGPVSCTEPPFTPRP